MQGGLVWQGCRLKPVGNAQVSGFPIRNQIIQKQSSKLPPEACFALGRFQRTIKQRATALLDLIN